MVVKHKTKLWRADDLGGVELLHAEYTNHSFAPHFHKTFSIAIIEAQAMKFYAGGSTYTVAPGYIGINNPGVVHTGSSATGSGWAYRNLYPSIEILTSLATELTGHPAPMPAFPSLIYNPELVLLFLSLHRDLERRDSTLERQSRFRRALELLIARHADRRYAPTHAGRERRAVNEGTAFIEEHLTENITVDDLAGRVKLSSSHFTRVFRAQIGLPPHLYQTQLRLERAKRLLSQGHAIAQVALQVGFSDQSHLTRKFKRFVGVTPSQYVRSL